jgi:hypothetical protein
VDAIAKKSGSRTLRSRALAERANNAPQNMRARKTEAMILEMMPARTWMTCTAVSRLIRAADDRKTRSRLDRLARDGKIKCKSEQSSRGLVYLFCRLP